MSAPQAAGEFLVVRQLGKYFGEFPALQNVSFSMEAGQCLALLGRNGAGKTTLLRILSGLSGSTDGEVRLFGAAGQSQAAKRRIGVLGHGIGVYEELTAQENLQLFAGLYEVENPKATAERWLQRTNLAHVADAPVREFSRGMRQRLAIARVFLHEPALLLLDEPFTSLDDRAIALLQSLIAEAIGRGAAVIMSTHQLREAMELATHVALLERGKLRHFGPRLEDMLQDPTYVYRTFGSAA